MASFLRLLQSIPLSWMAVMVLVVMATPGMSWSGSRSSSSNTCCHLGGGSRGSFMVSSPGRSLTLPPLVRTNMLIWNLVGGAFMLTRCRSFLLGTQTLLVPELLLFILMNRFQKKIRTPTGSSNSYSQSSSSSSYASMNRAFPLFGIRCQDKYYQLEELEDKDVSTTELFLNANGTVEMGDTDGPMAVAAQGHWEVIPGTNDFRMTLIRRYETGSSSRDMGEFAYNLNRRYVGDMSMVGASVAITGVMYSDEKEEGGEIAAGYFNMIDATEERLGEDKKVP